MQRAHYKTPSLDPWKPWLCSLPWPTSLGGALVKLALAQGTTKAHQGLADTACQGQERDTAWQMRREQRCCSAVCTAPVQPRSRHRHPLPLAISRWHDLPSKRDVFQRLKLSGLRVEVDPVPGWLRAVESATLKVARSSTRGSGWALSGPASSLERRAAQSRQARPEEAQELR